jgi:DUF1365 family protein
MHSCIYEGSVTHRRWQPVTHEFRYRLFMVYLDLDELPSLVGDGGLIASNRYATRSLRRADHLYDAERPLATEVRELVRQRTGTWPGGPIQLLTQLRYFGYYFSPLNLFYVYNEHHGTRVDCVVAEVSNTPWNERHCYVLWDGNRTGRDDDLQFAHRKEFHVSPFMDMDMTYRWRLSEPGANLTVQLANLRGSEQLLDVGMTMQRRELSKQQLRHMTLRYPIMTARISSAIYYQALKLWWKKCPFYTHPRKQKNSTPVGPTSNRPSRKSTAA